MISKISGFLRNVPNPVGMFQTLLECFGSLRNLPDYNGSLRTPRDTFGSYRKLPIHEASRFLHLSLTLHNYVELSCNVSRSLELF
ncbi:hypothetical protein RHMOL_Rhmol11G0264800 [Rhododendron molle]|uniref:Uncharacterized protein n=1 Tax=Rhododendron molle TaxID=49168 RepID=A0ACC0LXI8_RHOML|nr:hypothetical protein RHMOL_Rhmol11G0264800 [Rhododendron molle]